MPVDVVQAETGDLACAEPQPGQQQHDRVVTASGRGAPVTGGQQCAQLCRRQGLRETGQLPARHRRHRRRQRHRDPAGQVQPTQQGPRHGDDQLRGPCRAPRTGSQHERDDIRGGQPSQVQPAIAGPAHDEGPCHVHVPGDRPRRQPTFGEQVAAVVAQQFLHWVEPDRRLGRQHTRRRKELQQRSHRLCRPVLHIPSRPPFDQILLDRRLAQVLHTQTRGQQPTIQMRDETDLLLSRGPGVTLPQQLRGEPGNVRSQRPTHDRPHHLDHDALLSNLGETSVKQAARLCRPHQPGIATLQQSQRGHRHIPEVGIMELMPTSA